MATSDADENIEDLISQAVEVWKHDQLVNLSAIWKQRPKGHYLAQVLAKRPDSEPRLGELLSHENELVIAYSPVALRIMDSALIGELRKDLLDSKRSITRLSGSFAIDPELEEFAREIQDEWQKKRRQ